MTNLAQKERDQFAELCERYDIQWCGKYGERGYDDTEKGILFANWNNIPAELCESLESEGYAIEWSDEWIISYEADKAYRCSPDSYSWTSYYVMTDDGDVIGGDEIESGDQADWYVNEYLLNEPSRCNLFKVRLASFGFVPLDETYESGFHPGQNDSPPKVFKALQASHPNHDVIFDLTGKGQFDVSWKCWIRPQEVDAD